MKIHYYLGPNQLADGQSATALCRQEIMDVKVIYFRLEPDSGRFLKIIETHTSYECRHCRIALVGRPYKACEEYFYRFVSGKDFRDKGREIEEAA